MRISPSSNEDKMVMLVAGPVGLSAGKKAWSVFSATCDFSPTLRYLGHTGIAINLYLQDGALHACLARYNKARHALYYSEFGPDAVDEQ